MKPDDNSKIIEENNKLIQEFLKLYPERVIKCPAFTRFVDYNLLKQFRDEIDNLCHP